MKKKNIKKYVKKSTISGLGLYIVFVQIYTILVIV